MDLLDLDNARPHRHRQLVASGRPTTVRATAAGAAPRHASPATAARARRAIRAPEYRGGGGGGGGVPDGDGVGARDGIRPAADTAAAAAAACSYVC